MHGWADTMDWFWMAFAMVVWVLLIASFGYAAALVALRPGHRTELHRLGERHVKKA